MKYNADRKGWLGWLPDDCIRCVTHPPSAPCNDSGSCCMFTTSAPGALCRVVWRPRPGFLFGVNANSRTVAICRIVTGWGRKGGYWSTDHFRTGGRFWWTAECWRSEGLWLGSSANKNQSISGQNAVMRPASKPRAHLNVDQLWRSYLLDSGLILQNQHIPRNPLCRLVNPLFVVILGGLESSTLHILMADLHYTSL